MSIDYMQGVRLERIERADLPKIRSWRNNPAIWRWCRQFDLIDEIHHEDWFERQSSDPSISMYKAMTNSGMMIGVCGLTSIDHVNRRAEFSLYVAPEYQGNGHSAAILRTLFRHGFDNLGLNSIWGETMEGNPAAHVFEKKLGMKDEGLRRDFYWRQGRFWDARIYSILAREWKNQ